MASVLIIDDNEGTRDSYSTILRLARFEAATASNGRAGIELALSRAFDVHLVDLRLPDISGVDVVRELTLIRVTGRLVIVTAFPGFESALAAGAVGADGYVNGPLWDSEIIDVVEQALNGPFPVQHPTARPLQFDRADIASPTSANMELDPTPSRALRIANVIAAFLASPSDVHSVEGLCLTGPVGAAPSTFRRWCDAEGIGPNKLLRFARLLRALGLARKHGSLPIEWLEVDPRTFKALLENGRVTALFADRIPHFSEFIVHQRFVSNPIVLKLAHQACVDLDRKSALA